ncbi:MAG TPA: Gfo/Idh/MocA family oxidoreductase [Thermomicrobiales bacterium]
MNIATLGYGSIARSHVRAISALAATAEWADLRLYGVMGRLEGPTTDFAEEFGATVATTDLDTLLADPALDAVIVCSPSGSHAEQTARALRAGKHVLCEIPLALSLAETDELIALADQHDRRLMVCHTQRYYPPLVEARRRIASGELHPHAIVSRYMFGRRENVNWQGRQRSWTDNLLWHHGCHAVDAALWLLGAADNGEEVAVTAQVALPGGSLEIPMDLTVAMRTARDQLATVAMSYNIGFQVHDYLIIGEEATILFDDGVLRDNERVLVPKADRDGVDAPIPRQDVEFFAAIREGREPAVSGRAVRPAMAALQAAQDALNARLAELGPEARHPQKP